MSRITNELQEEVMRSRMFPVENVFNRFPRMVRDLAKKADKKVNFVVEGKETELDRSVVEEIGDPLIHLLRNAIDHGIESVEDRVAAGKSEEGTITLSARHAENHIVIAVRDDGKGIDGASVREKVVIKGLLSPEAADRLKDSESVDLIFLPGLSTAGEVSEVSGRGVGMDIVKNNTEKLNGTVSISTELGVGSVFEIKMPLTLAIIRALLIGLDSRVFAVPLVSVKETIESRAEDVQTIRGREVIRLRGKVLPLLRLAESYRRLRPPQASDDQEFSNGEVKRHSYVVAVRVGDRQVGLVVDKLLGEQEVVIKSLGEFIGDVNRIAGATILGDGSVAMIVDINSLLQESLVAA
jgi:two-component system chemotaxis sensor kinase CheA